MALGYRRHTIEISDGGTPSIAQLHTFIDLVGSVGSGARVLMHCEGGCGRTGTLAAAFWIGKGLSVAKAIAKVRQANRFAIETSGQEQVLETFARDVGEICRRSADTFARLVALLYREVGVVDGNNHLEIAAKRKLSSGFFATPQRRTMAREIDLATSGKRDPGAVVAAFEGRTALSLEDVERAFREGQWRNSSGGYSYGGPKWARVAKCALSLRDACQDHDVPRIKGLLREVDTLEHNNGKVVAKFRELDRS